MKKYCVYPNKKYLKNRAQKKLKRKRKNRYKKLKLVRKNNEKQKIYNVYKPKTKKTHDAIEIIAPSNFSVINEPNQMIAFFNTIIIKSKKKRKIFIDLTDVNNITIDAILYMRAVFDYFKQKYKFSNFNGNAPKDKKSRELFINSGWYNYVSSNLNTNNKRDDILAIESNELVLGEIAKKVIDFTMDRLKMSKSVTTRAIYTTLIECMTNTREHAYKKNAEVPKWYLMAVHNEDKDVIEFSFIDGGLGIPSTIRKTKMEQIKELFGSIGLRDKDLIFSALKGELRTRTKHGYRGRGLPKIKKLSENGYIDNLIIISNKGFVNIYKKNKNLDIKMKGSLFSWTIEKNGV